MENPKSIFNCYLKGNILSHYQQLDKWFVAAKIVQILDLRKLFEMVETNLIFSGSFDAFNNEIGYV